MRVLILGGSGRTGVLVIDEALKRGHTVTALVRKPEAMVSKHGLQLVEGTPTEEGDIRKAIQATEDTPQAIIVTLNAVRESDSPFAKPLTPPRFLADCIANARSSMQVFSINKIVIMSAWGVADSFQSLNRLMKFTITHTNMKAQFKDHDAVDAETKASGVKWVLVRPVMLGGEEALPIKFQGDQGEHAGWLPKISRASVANFLIDAIEKEQWDGRTPVISN